MKLHRFIGNFDLSRNEIEIKNSEIIKQIRLILRLQIGEKILLGDGKGIEAEIEIITIQKDKILGKILNKTESKETNRNVSLYLAILKKENFELAVQKAVECGVTNIIPVITERTVKTGLNISRLEKIIREASEQSGRSIVPKLFEIMHFKEALEHGQQNEEKVIFHLGGIEYRPGGGDASAWPTSTSIFIGPEGGFTEKEILLAQNTDYIVASLGTLTLRAETAAIVASYLTVHLGVELPS